MISVIIPTYNRADLLEHAIQSAIHQTYRDIEILIVDDGSTDHTKDVVHRLSLQFPQTAIRYIKQDENQGPSVARNIGIRQAKGEYIAFLDSDDVWMEEKLEKQLQILKSADETTAMVYCEYYYHGAFGEEGISPSREIKAEIKSGDILLALLVVPLIGTPTIVIKKECLQKVGMFDETLHSLEDYELSLRIAKEYKIAFVPEPLMHVYARRESVSFRVKDVLETKAKIIAKYKHELTTNELFEPVKEEYLNLAEEFQVKESALSYLNILLEQQI